MELVKNYAFNCSPHVSEKCAAQQQLTKDMKTQRKTHNTIKWLLQRDWLVWLVLTSEVRMTLDDEGAPPGGNTIELNETFY